MSYSSAIYLLDKRRKVGINIKNTGDITLESSMSFEYIADVLATSQVKCFKDKNVTYNKNRLLRLFSSNFQPIVAVIISIGHTTHDNIRNVVLSTGDVGTLAIQRASLSSLTNNIVKPNEEGVLWITDVCRSTFNEKKTKDAGPVAEVMKLTEFFASFRSQRAIYLMVEKYPEYGSGETLLKYYGTGINSGTRKRGGYGFKIMNIDNPKYWFLKKGIVKRRRKSKRVY